MPVNQHNPFTTIHTEGALLPIDLLQRIVAGDSTLGGLDAESYHLPGSEKLNEAINRSWNRLLGAWAAFQTSRGRLGVGDVGTTLTRERWLMPFFQELGYGRLQAAKAIILEGKEYRVSHAWGEVPIHIVGCGVNLERRQAGVTGAAKSSPHSLMQEYLNRNPNQLWGMLSNGLTLRVLRDNASMTRQAYLEFDLEAMLTGEVYADFVVLWLVCHQSRVETQEGKPETCWLETWSKAAQEQGTRALDKLRDGVEQAITALGGGFLAHPGNTALKARLRSGALTREGYYRQLLRLVYRLIFLFASEDRDLLLDPQASSAARERYLKYYSATHLRHLAEQSRGGRHPDLYTTLRLVSAMLGGREASGVGSKGLGLPVLGSFLFSAEALPDLETAELENSALLSAVRGLAFILDGNTRRTVDYRNLGTRELGSVYESLLELHPLINMDAGMFELITSAGNERKTTGSYYTAEDLIKVLLDSALDPVILQAIQRAGPSIEAQIAALLALKVCDPACGSGHFLIAAARRIARRLAQLRSGDEEPSPEITRTALREVIQHCVYGVDINPMSVELCKVNLWLESIEPGKPLSFLDAHIRCGNSLVGLGPKMQVNELEVPDNAFQAVTGDHKPTAALLKKRNKQEREGQESLFVTMLKTREDLGAWLAEQARALEAMPEESAAEVQAKAEAYQQVSASAEYRRQQQIADLWTAAFFWQIKEPAGKALEITAPTLRQLRRLRGGSATQMGLQEEVARIRESLGFFHWPLEFAEVAAQGGFDCILGNPPWERIKLQEEEFFATRDPMIATAANKVARQKVIDQLTKTNPVLAQAFEEAKHAAEGSSKFMRASGRYPLTAVGDVNTYALFAEHFRVLLGTHGRAGIILPTGIATDDTTKKFFGDLIFNHALAQLWGFENEDFIFPAVHHAFKFCALVIVGQSEKVVSPDFVFFCRNFEKLKQFERHFTFTSQDIATVNPNTRTIPIFRTRTDAELTLKIYRRIPVLENENSGQNNWEISFLTMLHMANDSNLFLNKPTESSLSLYEAKMVWLYNHRFGTYEGRIDRGFTNLEPATTEQLRDVAWKPMSFYSVEKSIVDGRLKNYSSMWLMGFRDVTNATNERTVIFSIIPKSGVGHTLPLMFTNYTNKLPCLLGCLNSIILDYTARQKVSGMHLTFTYLRQLPVLPPEIFTPADLDFIAPRVLELVYTAYDLKPFAEDMGYYSEPFSWDEDRRALLRAELDAYYARLYGLTRDELRYILDPQDVYGPDFPGETFRVLKDKEMRLYGEYRTRRLVLEAWDRLEGVAPAPVSVPVEVSTSPKTESKAVQVKPVVEQAKEKSMPEPAPESQPMLSNFGLYKCGVCGKMVMGYDRENHQKETHSGKSVEWRKMR
ncbi:type I restriction-modification system methyltransferase subunit [Longilinea arvoryzae]|uniref:site-specific DNA-methyltransferase (adenine-specific) n=1 Tax=Longilinea arvoryzae TaxID=360412 RepID=A0A0S7B7D4_9CHLR|nr:N-6 DNA methylase [Longilinea arvoryzae]GAP13247.1 type I restriction-modification system methyltransferase subunit [Longilinea arvoryzae]